MKTSELEVVRHRVEDVSREMDRRLDGVLGTGVFKMLWRLGIFAFWVLGDWEVSCCKSLACGALSVFGMVAKLV